MRRVFRGVIFTAVAVLFAVSCKRNDGLEGEKGDGILRIVPSMHSSDHLPQGIATRAQIATASKVSFVDGDQIGVYVTRSEDSLVLASNEMRGFDYSNLLYTRAGGSFATNEGSPAGTIYYPYRDVNVDLWGIFPYDASAKNKNSAVYEWTVADDQSSAGAVLASDFMVSRVGGVSPSQSTAVAMEFEHRTARLYLRLQVPTEIDGKLLKMSDPISEIFLEGMTNEGLHNFNLDKFTAAQGGEVVKMIPLARGQENVDDNDSKQGIYLYYELLAVPQKVAAGAQFLRLIANYESGSQGLFVLEIAADFTFEQGKQHLYEVGFDNNQRLRLDGTKILDWNEASHVESDLEEIESVRIGGVEWAVGNLVADGANGCKIGEPGDGGLYFQYGGLIGYKGGANGDGTGIVDVSLEGKWWDGDTAYSANEVAVAPSGYTNQATWPFHEKASGGFGYYYFNNFVDAYADFQTQANANNPILGIGDPCTYYLGSPWRLPTVYELSAITGRTEEDVVNWSSVTGKWTNSGPKSAIGGWFGPNARTGVPSANTDLFIPASGCRYYDDGTFISVDAEGFLWGSSVYDAVSGFGLFISEVSNVIPRSSDSRTFANPVRCVKDIKTEPNPPAPDQIVEINGLKWTKGNLVADGANGCKVGEPGDGGLYFQYGGLVGYKGGANGDGTGITNATTHADTKFWGGATDYSVGDVSVVPSGYTHQATWPHHEKASGGFGYYYFNTFVTKYADFQTQANANNPTLGIGDPCAYYLGSPWRLPKYDELSSITGSAVENGFASWGVVTAKWTTSGPQSAIGAWFGPNARTGVPSANTDLFIPASGYRFFTDGPFYWVGSYGFLWSSSVDNDTNGIHLRFYESHGVAPRNKFSRAYGMPVRCVSDLPHNPQPPTADQIVTINGLKWTKGNLVAHGANNIKVGAPEDGGLYFQYGGLVGYKGGANGDGTGINTHIDGELWNGATVYSANDVAVAPSGYTHQATWPYHEKASGGFGYYYFNTFVTKYADFQGQPGANNPTLGIGDPCAYYLGSPWRLPKYDELSAITGSVVESDWVEWSTTGVTGKWTDSGPQSTIGAWFGPNSRNGTPTLNTDLFIPASGYRYFGFGAFRHVGVEGFLWSSSVYNDINGFYLQINESRVYPRYWDNRAYAKPIRCVQDLPPVEINGVKWALTNVSNSANWDTAMTLCKSPWRLPSKTDFENLINLGRMSEVPDISSYAYWSSTEYDTDRAYFLGNDYLDNFDKSALSSVRCCQ